MYDTVANWAYSALAALWFLLAVVKLLAWRRQRFTALLVMWLASAVTALSFLCSVPVVARAVNETSGVSYLGLFLVYVARLLFSAGAIVLVLLWSPPAAGRRHGRPWDLPYAEVRAEVRRKVVQVFAPVIAAMTVLFASFPRGLDSSRPLDTTYADRPAVLAFLVVYQAGFAWGLWQLGQVCRRHAAALHAQDLLRRSLRQLMCGCVLIGGYCLTKIAVIAASAAGTTATDWIGALISPLLGCLGAVIAALGWGGAAAAHWRQRRADYRALRPLWAAALQIDQRLALDRPPPRWSEWLAGRDLEWRITRRTREIRDGQLALRAWVPADVVATARVHAQELADMPPLEKEAVIAAAAFAAGLRTLRAGQPPRQHCQDTPGIQVSPADERRHLVLLARHLHGTFVARVLAET